MRGVAVLRAANFEMLVDIAAWVKLSKENQLVQKEDLIFAQELGRDLEEARNSFEDLTKKLNDVSAVVSCLSAAKIKGAN